MRAVQEGEGATRTRKILRRFDTAEEFNAFMGDGAGPTREDDTPVLVGANGRRATPEELRAFVEEELRRRERGEG
jgi:hypothetical protein